MKKIVKEEIVRVILELKKMGYSEEELAVALNKTQQTIWAWGSFATKRVPCKSDYEVLKRMTVK